MRMLQVRRWTRLPSAFVAPRRLTSSLSTSSSVARFKFRCKPLGDGAVARLELLRGDLLRDVKADVLVNSANEGLCGTQFPYFPLNPDCENNEIYYKDDVLDGQLHALAGRELEKACERVPPLDGPQRGIVLRCDVGDVRLTEAPGGLGERFQCIAHAVAPLWDGDEDGADGQERSHELRSAHAAAYTAASSAGWTSVAMPLLGAGAKRFPLSLAVSIATEAAVAALMEQQVERVVLVARESEAFNTLLDAAKRDVQLQTDEASVE